MASKTPLNILILHQHWDNRGDEAAMRAMIESLRAHLPIQRIWVMMMTTAVEQFPFNDVEVLQYYPYGLSLMCRLDTLFIVLTLGRLSFTRRGRDFVRAARQADIVIHAPGGPNIGDLGRPAELGYLYRLFVVSVLHRKPLFFYAPSMGPFSGRIRNHLRRYLLKKAQVVTVREEISQGYLRDQLGVPAEVTVDSAFQNDVPYQYLSRYDTLDEILMTIEGRPTIGIVMTDLQWYWPKAGNAGAGKAIECFREVIPHLTTKGYVVLLIPQLFGVAEDSSLLETIRTVDPRNTFVCPSGVDAYGQQVLVSKLFCVISMRYHPVVFAAKVNVPFISIYYEHKAEGFARRVGLSEFAFPVEELTASEIIKRFATLEASHAALKEHLASVNPLMKAQSRRTTELIVQRLAGLESRTTKSAVSQSARGP